MKRSIFSIITLFWLYNSNAQTKTNSDTLLQLARLESPINTYVNFEAIKVLYGTQLPDADYGRKGFASSLNVQLLYPFALFKESFLPIAWGICIGNEKMRFEHRHFVFTDHALSAITENAGTAYTEQKTGYFGLVLLPIIQFSRRIDLMAGGAVHFNVLGNKYAEYGISGMEEHINKAVNIVSLPALLQLSYKPGLLAIGVFASFDIIPRFKNAAIKSPKQQSAGISVGIVL